MKLAPNSLYLRLVLLCVAGSALSALVLGGFIAHEQGRLATDAANQQAQTISTSLANALAEDLVTRNYAGIDQTVQQAGSHPELKNIQVANAHGSLIVEMQGDGRVLHRPGQIQPPTINAMQSVNEDGRIVTWMPVQAGGLVGWVRTDLALDHIAAAQRQILLDTVLIALLAVSASLLFATLVLRRPVNEIRLAASFATSLPEKHDQSLNIDAHSSEVAHLVAALNSAARELLEQDHELVELNRDFITLLESSTDFIYFKDRDSRIRFCSQTLADITGHQNWRDMTGKHDNEIFTPEIASIYSEEELPIFRDGVAILNRIDPYLDAAGKPRWVSTSKWPVFGEDGKTVIGIFGISRDVTEQRAAESQLRESREMAEHIAQVKSEFLANMSHEIRTPMNGIIGLAQLALNQRSSPELRDYLQKIESSSQSLLGILNDILDFSKLEAGRMSIEHNRFELDTVADNLRNLFEERAHAKHLDFHIEIADDVPGELVGDAMRLQQILINLLGNAIKFTAEGHITLRVHALDRRDTQAVLRFAVEDSGIGIARDDIDNLFQPFNQVDASITRRFGGTGLGLAISHTLLELMGSRFEVVSEPGRGTTFSFDLRLDLAKGRSRRPAAKRLSSEAGVLGHSLDDLALKLHGAHILVAEDNAINQQVVREFLSLSGMRVTIAGDGRQALEALQKDTFDAVLMDVHMPVMGGVEATRCIREQAGFADLPVIALTAGVTQEERDNCLGCGMNDFIAKPLNPETLIRTLGQWVDKTTVRVAPPATAGQPVVLIVNDDPQSLHALGASLRREYQVKVATGGATALEIARRTPPPDLILLDADMPELTGYDVCRQLDERAETRDIPVLLMLADGIIGGQAMAEKIGVAGLVEASASHADILDRIRRTLNLISSGEHP